MRLAAEQRRQPEQPNEFDDVRLVHHALTGIDRREVDLTTTVAGMRWRVPIYINAMTGGSAATGRLNRELAVAARETGVAIATGSQSAFLADSSTADTFRVVRRENPDGFVLANINATIGLDDARRAVDLLEADALQIHLNSVQETVMPEGDRSFREWASAIERIAGGVSVPVIVKEVGFGLSRETVALLSDLGVAAADVAGRGGTNFAMIENGRRPGGEYRFLADWGQSAPACLLDSAGLGVPLLASGGVRHPLDVVRGLALGAVAVGVSGRFLATLVDRGPAALVEDITTWVDQLAALMTTLGAATPAALADCDVVVRGELAAFCAARGIAVGDLATRRARTAPAIRTTPAVPV
ncbi:isopentenyl-diphosphate delta-isomerase [Nocardia mexicana]|uniref:Isopentenyl-diphosphate delta-isomerase n=1 Tax=Nocardia mexicana TaxID=279262 RepID=A0A370H437_9NOCA|nr:isopentenyl-diphosphate delta-isomerase [Nocardia mexicana]